MADRHSRAQARDSTGGPSPERAASPAGSGGERAYCVAERLGRCPSEVLRVLHDLGYRGSRASTVLAPRIVTEVESVLIATRD
ncbi:hypothetical protein FHR81_003548 [Actinoalloteichus hoggarensis]|uniref:Uncharacterized protein n=1 Tax=Actinoalloteichus hoggarensis TaxID=1470176 RepID=A0A221W8P9_9PSEU|nr:hypothetical protein [Actinoalloteichus hoggarensis]ASO21899.1 hypothetical protein AHOG_21415 [Actinoalloteichus hoggarensis]MBB5922496.1 hypothetical protein [Actinoalloteichus hoggarensis]